MFGVMICDRKDLLTCHDLNKTEYCVLLEIVSQLDDTIIFDFFLRKSSYLCLFRPVLWSL
jgi:hypothetical protein